MIHLSPNRLPPFSPTASTLELYKLSTWGLNSFATIGLMLSRKSVVSFPCDRRAGKGRVIDAKAPVNTTSCVSSKTSNGVCGVPRGTCGGRWGRKWEKVLRKVLADHNIESVDSGVAPAFAHE